MTGNTSPSHSSRDLIAAQLEEELLSGRFPVGAKLPSERQLAARLGVGRQTVREALRIVAERGLLEVSPGRGAFSRDVADAQIARPMAAIIRQRNATPRDLVQARMMLECEAAAIAAERATPEDIADLQAALGRIERATNVINRARADVAFHLRISQAAHNPVIETMFVSISGLAFEHMLRSNTDDQIVNEAHPFHVEVVEAIRRRDAGRARRAMKRHLTVATLRYGGDFDLTIEHLARRELERLQQLGTIESMRDHGRSGRLVLEGASGTLADQSAPTVLGRR